MVVDMSYWTKVLRRLLIFAITIVGIYLSFKLAIFYMPFLIAFIISLLIEPLIRRLSRRANIERKKSAIVILIIVVVILLGLLIWGIATLITESSNLLGNLNEYFDKAYTQIQNLVSSINLDKVKIPQEVINVFNNSSQNFLSLITDKAKDMLTGVLNVITSIPGLAIYAGITLLATYFICTDRIYILDQIEHHLPRNWMRKITIHMKEIIAQLGSYLKAEATLILISFIITIIGMLIMQVIGLNVKYPIIAAIGIGFVDALPIVGSGTVIVPWAVVSAINGDIRLAIALLILFALISVARQFLEPRIVSKNIGTHPIFTLIAMYTGFKIMGVGGLLLGPIILIIFKNIFGTLIDKGVIKTIFDRK